MCFMCLYLLFSHLFCFDSVRPSTISIFSLISPFLTTFFSRIVQITHSVIQLRIWVVYILTSYYYGPSEKTHSILWILHNIVHPRSVCEKELFCCCTDAECLLSCICYSAYLTNLPYNMWTVLHMWTYFQQAQ